MASVVESIRNTIGENFGGAASQLSTSQFSLEEVPDLSGKVSYVACSKNVLAEANILQVAVVTGGGEGVY